MTAQHPCTFEKACFVLYLVTVTGATQTEAAIKAGLNVGTVCHVVHGRRFPGAFPLKPPGY